MCNPNPVGIIFVTAGTRGDKLLFRYPYESVESTEVTSKFGGRNPYAIKIREDAQAYRATTSTTSCIIKGVLVGLSDQILAHLLAVKSDYLCSQRFDVKIDDVRFVGFPLLLHHTPKQTIGGKAPHTILSFNIVLVLRANANASVISCCQDLAKQLTLAIQNEEHRCQYLSAQTKIMMGAHDEVATMPEDSVVSPFKLILQRCQLARDLKSVYDTLCETGVVQLYINHWVEVNFCLPHKIHTVLPSQKDLKIEPEDIQKCLRALRFKPEHVHVTVKGNPDRLDGLTSYGHPPYHAMLLLVDEQVLLDSLPMDCTPTISRLIRINSPLKSLQKLALDSDLSLSQIFRLVCHLVYWAKATIIYPLCETNVYVLAPNANTFVHSKLVKSFVQLFPGIALPAVMAEFSFPTPLGEHRDVLGLPQQQAQKVQIVVWMLQHRLLMQLHTYVFLVPPATSRPKRVSDDSLTPTTPSQHWPIMPNQSSHLLPDVIVEESSKIVRTSSASDISSVTSEEGVTLSTMHGYSTQLSKSPSSEANFDGINVSEEVRTQWQALESALCKLLPAQRRCILQVPAAREIEDIRLFTRLCPYFDGKHHLEEIMYYENVRRSQIVTLLDKFWDVIVTCVHHDPATAIHVKS